MISLNVFISDGSFSCLLSYVGNVYLLAYQNVILS